MESCLLSLRACAKMLASCLRIHSARFSGGASQNAGHESAPPSWLWPFSLCSRAGGAGGRRRVSAHRSKRR